MSQTHCQSTSQTAESTRRAVGLPISWYFDPEILEIERRAAVCRRADVRRPHVARAATTATTSLLGGQQAGKLLVRNNGRPQLVSNVCRHRQAQMLTGCGPREEHRLPGPQLGLRPRRPAGRRAAFRRESVPRFGADRADRVERPVVRRPARRSPRARAARRLDRARRRRTTCWSASTKKSTTSIGRCSSRFTWKTTTSASCIRAFARWSIRPTCGRACKPSAASGSSASR